ncbi:MAG TPA: hypothetical protein VLT16_08555 [Candidatus Limnocylindrales bacterium]|nr:hypothetical protein [Candidatus Limnocylindrales bacterium]
MFRKITTAFAAIAVIASGAAAQAPGTQVTPASSPNTVKIHKRTVLTFSTRQPVTSATAEPGDDVPLELKAPLTVNGITVMKQGQVVHAIVASAKKAKPGCSNGQLKLKMERITFPDTSSVKAKVWTAEDAPFTVVDGRLYKERRPWTGEDMNPFPPANNWYEAVLAVPLDALMIAIESPILVPVGIFYLIGAGGGCWEKGAEYELPAGTTFTVTIEKDHRVRY